MMANYGYEDASGNYYIRIDTDICAECQEKGCLRACPAQLFELECDDEDNDVAVIKETMRNTLKSQCANCKPHVGRPEVLPCVAACSEGAIVHSW